MRIDCSRVEDFIENLQGVASDALYLKRLWIDVDRNPLNGTKATATSWEVTLWAAAMVVDESGDGYLIELGQYCGIDRCTSDGSNGGTDQASDVRSKLKAFCGRQGWEVQPGRLKDF